MSKLSLNSRLQRLPVNGGHELNETRSARAWEALQRKMASDEVSMRFPSPFVDATNRWIREFGIRYGEDGVATDFCDRVRAFIGVHGGRRPSDMDGADVEEAQLACQLMRYRKRCKSKRSVPALVQRLLLEFDESDFSCFLMEFEDFWNADRRGPLPTAKKLSQAVVSDES